MYHKLHTLLRGRWDPLSPGLLRSKRSLIVAENRNKYFVSTSLLFISIAMTWYTIRINNGVFFFLFFSPCVFTDPGAVYREMEICARERTHTCELQQEALRGPWRASPRGLFLRAPGLRSDSSSPWTAPGRYHPSYPTRAHTHTHARENEKEKTSHRPFYMPRENKQRL